MRFSLVRIALWACLCAATAALASAGAETRSASLAAQAEPLPAALVLTDRIVVDRYAGCGVEWDPYEVHDASGGFSDADRKRLTDRLEFMRPRLVRVMTNIASHLDPAGRFDPARTPDDLHLILGFCQSHGATVLLGDWGGGVVDRAAGRVRAERIDRCGELVSYLVDTCGYDCIRYFNLVNEPNGWWSATDGDYALWLRAARTMEDALRRRGLGRRVTLAGPDVAVWTPAETPWVSDCARDLGDAVGLWDIHTYPSKVQVNSGEYSRLLAAYRTAAPAGAPMILGELGLKFVDPRDSLLAAENDRRIAADPWASPSDSQFFVFDTGYGTDIADAVMQSAACGYAGCVVWMLDDAMHLCEPGKLKTWGFWNILGEERYGADRERIRPWYYAVSLLCRYFPPRMRILASEVTGAEGVRSMFGRSAEGTTLALSTRAATGRSR
ncbi:hypothetical protein [Alistipes sp.]|uniref:hypothetical protein n=1 Tax=Alistipes sp. TaxID=1872444 RepID=UPI003AF02922